MTQSEPTNTDKQREDVHPIQAAEIDLTAPNPGSKNIDQDSDSSPITQVEKRPTVLIALAVCAIVALAVVFLLPGIVADRQQQDSARDDEKNSPTDTTKAPQQSSPVIEQGELKARRLVQDALIRIGEKQSALEDKNIEVWAANEYQAALAELQEGELYYREQLYSKSLQAYSSAEANLDRLEAQVEPRLKQALSKGFSELEAGNADSATESFGTALAIDPTHTEAKQGMARLNVLPEVLKHIANGEQLLKKGTPNGALAAFEQALTLDPNHSLARTGQKRAQQDIDDARYQNAMSAGFNHLNSGDYPRAVSAFKQALSVVPDSSGARSALAEAQARQTETQIERLLKQARANEKQENWRDATRHYQQALKYDNTMTEARVGQIRASTRAELDDKIKVILADPLRLSSTSIYRRAEQLLADAQGISDPGAKLGEQIGGLQQVLSTARLPVSLILQSDNLTNITLLKTGVLGAFTRKQIELTPGRYVAKGYRKGYRDVRVEFSVTAEGANPQVVQVQCDETI